MFEEPHTVDTSSTGERIKRVSEVGVSGSLKKKEDGTRRQYTAIIRDDVHNDSVRFVYFRRVAK